MLHPGSSRKSLSFISVSLVLYSTTAFGANYSNTTQWNQINLAPSYTFSINGTQQTVAPTGSGITVGVIDTGATTGWVGNAGTGGVVLGACTLASCANSVDNNGHGTFVSSEIVSNIPSVGMKGIANGAKVLAVKVLDANGSGTSTSVANGIISATNSGAHILNLSLGPGGTAAQQAAFYNSISGAVNYAASKGVFVVFAGGNAHQALSAGANITGFTDAAIQRMLFVGSVNAANVVSSFSNTPGTAGFISTTNKFYAYNNMWVMADGENLWGASNYYTKQSGYSYLTQMSGTSMAAPQAAAVLALLESQWAILRTNGTAAQLVEQTSKDLGAKGTDAVYGTGLINLTQAMQPVGTLTVQQANGKSVALSSVTGQVVLGGAFGAVSGGKLSSALQTALSNYTTFDGFGRNYKVNLANLVGGTSSSSSTASSVGAPKTTGGAAKFADGSSVSFGSVGSNYDAAHPTGHADAKNWFMSFTNAGGATVAAGNGVSSSASFASALWGSDDSAAQQVAALSATSTLSNIASGGSFLAYGSNLNNNMRMAFSFSQTKTDDALTGDSTSNASAFNTGVTRRLGENLTGGLTLGILDQTNGLLDTTYSGNALSLGESHKSVSFGTTATYALSDTQELVFDAAIIRTNGASVSEGFITGTSPMYARSLGAAYVEHDSFQPGDDLTLSLRAPVRVFSGSVSMLTTDVDQNGLPVTTTQHIGMSPSGNELDLTFGYQAPATEEGFSWNMTVEARHDAGNIAGENDATFLTRSRLVF